MRRCELLLPRQLRARSTTQRRSALAAIARNVFARGTAVRPADPAYSRRAAACGRRPLRWIGRAFSRSGGGGGTMTTNSGQSIAGQTHCAACNVPVASPNSCTAAIDLVRCVRARRHRPRCGLAALPRLRPFALTRPALTDCTSPPVARGRARLCGHLDPDRNPQREASISPSCRRRTDSGRRAAALSRGP